LRDLTSRRKRLLSHITAEKNRIQKVLEDANVKLGNVLSDVFDVSGQLMLEALLDSKRTLCETENQWLNEIEVVAPRKEAAESHHRVNGYSL
jgi:hypothetical protein